MAILAETMIEQLLPHGFVREHRFHPVRKWRFDYAWPAYRIALEIEGAVWRRGRHTRGSGFVGDMDKYNEATILGWRLLRVTRQQFDSGQAARIVRAAMKALGKVNREWV